MLPHAIPTAGMELHILSVVSIRILTIYHPDVTQFIQ